MKLMKRKSKDQRQKQLNYQNNEIFKFRVIRKNSRNLNHREMKSKMNQKRKDS